MHTETDFKARQNGQVEAVNRRILRAMLATRQNHGGRQTIRPRFSGRTTGRAQLSFVEHSLCPLDAAASLVEHLVHETSYKFTDRNGHQKSASVRVLCPSGLSAADELTLWGLLAITFSQPEPDGELCATPHYCLRQLGIIPDNIHKGGKQFLMFRETIRRLSRVLYENTAFYDPIRGEHRDVAFGFLKYSLPLDPASSRMWRIVWDPLFFEICKATAGSFCFDLATYRRLDFASRRLFILLQKIFYRREVSPVFDVRGLAVDLIGFARHLEVWMLKPKLARCLDRLAQEGIIRLPEGASSSSDVFKKRGVGEYSVQLERGPYFDRPRNAAAPLTTDDSPLVDPLRAVGLDDGAIARVLAEFKPSLVREWADITLAARERNGDEFFKKSAAAYLMDNLKNAKAGTRTPPDWWREMRVAELCKQREAQHETLRSSVTAATSEEGLFRAYLNQEAREAFERVTTDLIQKLTEGGKPHEEARETAAYMARLHFLNRFRRDHPELRGDEAQRLMPDDLRRP